MTVRRMTQKDPKKSSSQAVNHALIKRNALPFNNYVRQQLDKHLDENLDRYFKTKDTASERRVLTTK